jgi:predicted DNA-binding protein YlxM (UPF0122 family)
VKQENLKNLSDEKFRRITGVKRTTFNKMMELIKQHEELKIKKAKAPGGRPSKLSTEQKLLMTLEYMREYRTYAHIAVSYNISETRAFEHIRETENILIKSKEFRLPGKKSLLKSDHEYEVVLVDASETPIERPKKNKKGFIQGRRNVIL